MLNFTILMFGLFQIVDIPQEENFHQENHEEISTLREQLTTSLEQTGNFFVEFNQARDLLMKLSTSLSQTENRFQDLQVAYDALYQDFLQVQQERDHLQANSQARISRTQELQETLRMLHARYKFIMQQLLD